MWHDDAVDADTLEALELRRLALADAFEGLGPEEWQAPSWCEGWSAHLVLAHLVDLAEGSTAPMLRDLARARFGLDRALDRRARAAAAAPPADLIGRFRASARGTFRAPGAPLEAALGEVFVHGADVLGPLGRELDAPPEAVALVLPVYRRLGRVGFHARGNGRVRMIATDTDWSAGSGAEVRGRAVDLLLFMANRRQVISRLDGPGLAQWGGPAGA